MNAHLLIVHFPIAIVVLGAATDGAGLALGNLALRARAGQLVILGGIATFFAFVTGEGAKLRALMDPSVDAAIVAAHEQWASVGVWVLLGVAISRAMWRGRLEGPAGWGNLAIALGAAALVIGITLSGTAVRH